MSWTSLLKSTPRERCQFENTFYRYTFPYSLVRWPRHRLFLYARHARPAVGRGSPSRYEVGDWVRVKAPEAIRATLDDAARLRGLWFTTNQSAYCGHTYQVERVVRRILGDDFRVRSISGTVALAGAVCDGLDGSVGCGRACSLFFRDEWLEPSADLADARTLSLVVRVKPLEEIESTLDRNGRLEGISLSNEMAAYSGNLYQVLRKVEDLWVELPHWKKRRGEWYVLDGVRCSGEPLGSEGACDRNCGLLWHRAWLDFNGLEGSRKQIADLVRDR